MNECQALLEIRYIVLEHRDGTSQFLIPAKDAIRIEELTREVLSHEPDRLARIAAAAREELARVERDGGDAGFALRVKALAGGDDGSN